MTIQYSYVERFVNKEERNFAQKKYACPLVIDADGFNDLDALKRFVALQSEAILKKIHKFGAVLFRGFAVNTEEDFESVIFSVEGIRGISEVFMSENGRDKVDNSKYVLYTNKLYKTGGGLDFGGIHSENYYVPDVPNFICFWCKTSSSFGGETGLVDMQNVYQKMPADLIQKLEERAFFTRQWSICEVAERYGLAEEEIKEILEGFGLLVQNDSIHMYKPSIFENADNRDKSFLINLSGELKNINNLFRGKFREDFCSVKWLFHKFLWDFPKASRFLNDLYLIVRHPRESIAQLANLHKEKKLKKVNNLPQRVSSIFKPEDLELLSNLLREEFCSFSWKPGDVLLVDNTRMCHFGMPGFGKRIIRAMICNPLLLNYSPAAPGCQSVCQSNSNTLGEKIRRIKEQRSL